MSFSWKYSVKQLGRLRVALWYEMPGEPLLIGYQKGGYVPRRPQILKIWASVLHDQHGRIITLTHHNSSMDGLEGPGRNEFNLLRYLAPFIFFAN